MKSILFGIAIVVICVADAAKTPGNYTSISTDGGCRLYIGNIRFSRQDTDKGAKPQVAYLDGQTSLYNNTDEPDVRCGNYSGNIVLSYSKVNYYDRAEEALKNITINLEIEFQKKFGWWKLHSLSVMATGDLISGGQEFEANWTGAVLDSADIGASYKFGYACSKTTAFSYSDERKSQPTYSIQFLNFHLQPFQYTKKGNKDGFTDNVDDCVAFFSASVWMALLTLALFVLIILSGVIMLSNMTTVNRFDDPKAKVLVITPKD